MRHGGNGHARHPRPGVLPFLPLALYFHRRRRRQVRAAPQSASDRLGSPAQRCEGERETGCVTGRPRRSAPGPGLRRGPLPDCPTDLLDLELLVRSVPTCVSARPFDTHVVSKRKRGEPLVIKHRMGFV